MLVHSKTVVKRGMAIRNELRFLKSIITVNPHHVLQDCISRYEMNIQTPLGNVWHLNAMLNISLKTFQERSINWKKQKDSNYLENNKIITILEILNAVMLRKIHSFIQSIN